MKGWLHLVLLLLTAVALSFLFQRLHVPAAWLFGPLVAGALFAVRGWESLAISSHVYIGAQAVIGASLGAGFSASTLSVLPQHPFIFLFAVLLILLTSLINGWILTRFTKLDAATAFLGTMPGGAGAMAAMSDSLHADSRLVVAMQYIRLLIILGSMALVVPILGHLHSAATGTTLVNTAPVVTGWKLAILALIALAGWIAGTYTRIPAGSFLIPALLYFLLAWFGVTLGAWPLWIRCAAYTVMGLRIGGQFHASTIATIRSIFLPVVGTSLLLLLGSIALAWVLTLRLHINAASAYLAATLGGLDSVAILSAELKVDTGIILTVQLVRLLCVLLFGPWLARGCAKWLQAKPLAA
jgi:membrane AbrB-like protein